jgi:amino acid transporter
MGPFWGFMEAWLSLVGSIFDMAIYPTLFTSYLIGVGPLVLLVLAVMRNKAESVGPINALQLGAILIAFGAVSYFLSTRFRSKPS